MGIRDARRLGAMGICILGLGLADTAGAAGFALTETSARGVGNAFSGGAAAAADGSTVFFNPAGMPTLLICKQFQSIFS